MNRFSWLALVLLVLMQGCSSGSTGADTRRYPCTQEEECASGFVCRAGFCQSEPGPVSPEDGGSGEDPDAGTPDAGGVPPTQLGFLSAAQTVDTGQCSAAAVLETRTAAGIAAPVERATAVTLSAQPTTGVGFFRDAACATATTSVTVTAGSSRTSFYFRGSVAQTVRIGAAATGLASASQDETLRTGPVSVSFVTSAQTLATNGCSGKMELEARDSGANPTFFSAPRSVTLSGSGLTFFSDATCATPLSGPVFAAGVPRLAFYFKGKTHGTIRLSAAVSGLTPVSQDQTIRQVVRSGFCEMLPGSLSVPCPITPDQIDLSRTVLFVQANPSGYSPDSGSLRCWLSARDRLTCSRNESEAYVYIVWKTVELGTGLKVQQLQPVCQGSSLVTVPIQTVSPEKTFLLVTSEQSGKALGEDDYYTAKLVGTNRVDLQFSANCTSSWKGSLQVVEADGIQVTRGTGAMSGTNTQAAYTNQPAVNPASSALLFTYRVSNAGSANLCDRVLRGELSSSTGVSFSRGAGVTTGCTTAVIDEISWQRIDFGALAKVQAVPVSLSQGQTTSTFNISAVDETRTVAFASGQAMNGQGGGESNFAGDELLGASLGAFEFDSSTELRISRDTTDSRAKWTTYVVQFEP